MDRHPPLGYVNAGEMALVGDNTEASSPDLHSRVVGHDAKPFTRSEMMNGQFHGAFLELQDLIRRGLDPRKPRSARSLHNHQRGWRRSACKMSLRCVATRRPESARHHHESRCRQCSP